MSRYTTITLAFLLAFFCTDSLHGQDLQESSQEEFQTGMTLFEQGLFAEAAARFKYVMETTGSEPVEEMAAWYLTRTLILIDSTAVADHTEGFVRTYPHSRHSAELLTDLGHGYMSDGQFRQAVTTFDRALSLGMSARKRAEVLYHMAEAAVADDANEEARGYFLGLADRYPESVWAPRALYSRGRLFLEVGDFPGSADAFELLRTRYPDDPMTLRIGTALGEAYYQQERFEEAADAFNEAIPYLDGDERFKAVYLAAESHNALNELEEAERLYRYYLNRRSEEDERFRQANYGLGWVFHKQQIYHWAAQAFEAAAVGDDEVAQKALYYQAANEKLTGRYGRSLNVFREFGERFTEGSFVETAYYEWAVTAFEVGRYVESIETLLPLARNLESLEDPGKILTFLGEAYYANGEYTRALQTFEIAAELDNQNPEAQLQARFQRAWILYFNQVYSEAQPEFQRVYEGMQAESLGGEALFWSADSHYQLQNYGPAARQFSSFISQYPEHEMVGAASYALGWSYFMMGDFENAIPPFERFMNNYEAPSIALFPYDIDTQLRIGDSWFALGQYENALVYYNRLIGAEPGGDYAMYQVANSHYRADRNFEAVSEFRRMLRIYPFSTLREQAQYNIAYIYLNSGNYEQAISEFRTVIEQYPNTEWAARSQYNIGDAWYNAGEYVNAAEAYQTVLDQYPESNYIMDAVSGIQYSHQSAGEPDRSNEVLEEFLDVNPSSTTADRLRYRQAESRYRTGDYAGAVREFSQYIRITNSDDLLPEAWYNLADARVRTGDLNSAVDNYLTLINDFPQSEQSTLALMELARIEFNRQEYGSARNYYQQLLEKGEGYQAEGYVGLGDVNLATGQVTQAMEAYENALVARPNSNEARLGTGKVHFQQNRYDDALDIFNEVSDMDATETGAEAQYMAGRVYQVREQNEQALQAYTRVSVLFEPFDTWVAESEYRTAEIFITEGRRGDAVSSLNYIIETWPGTDVARRARALLGN